MAITHATATGGLPAGSPTALTLEVEEEFLLVDPLSGANQPVADQVQAALPDTLQGHSRLDVHRSVLGMTTGVCTQLRELRTNLAVRRRAAADAAAGAGARLIAIGATPVGEPERDLAPHPRYQAMAERYGPVALEPAACGLHVYVGVADRDLAVHVCNHLQPWLPVIRALSGNSPVFTGTDTGHASWRYVQLLRWPGVGPTPWFDSADEYDHTVADLQTAGVLFDPSMIRWYARVSPTAPRVEIRVSDVCADLGDTVLAAALIRAAVATAVTDIAAGHPAPRLRDCLIAAAHWRAARDGLTRTLVDLRLGRARPAWELVNEFFATVSPALLSSGDLDLVVDELARLREHGGGATRQRDIYSRTGNLFAVLAAVAEQTTAG
ncbi:glutamate--cysteine ligase [Actinoplanes sp. NPDC051475]|uniref:carboxylate-amine ligase n=1 Tax=Actinoplanes sp. NPDC051475 TaxID=3157225 RepID=UPI00344E9451